MCAPPAGGGLSCGGGGGGGVLGVEWFASRTVPSSWAWIIFWVGGGGSDERNEIPAWPGIMSNGAVPSAPSV